MCTDQIETIGAKSTAHYTLAQSLLASGVPLNGIGCQGHLIVGELPSTADVVANYARFAALGLEWALTGACDAQRAGPLVPMPKLSSLTLPDANEQSWISE